MTVPLDRLDVQVESSIDFGSLKRNGMDIEFAAQHMIQYVSMLNGPSYMNLVKDF